MSSMQDDDNARSSDSAPAADWLCVVGRLSTEVSPNPNL